MLSLGSLCDGAFSDGGGGGADPSGEDGREHAPLPPLHTHRARLLLLELPEHVDLHVLESQLIGETLELGGEL